jgi:hypothetical protein
MVACKRRKWWSVINIKLDTDGLKYTGGGGTDDTATGDGSM